MQSCTCASDSGRSTTNLRRDEDLNHEMALDFENTEVRVICCAVCCRLQPHSHEPVGLAYAGSFRLAADQLLASNGHFDPQQDPPRWFSRAPRSSLVLEAPDDGALGTDDTRGTREVPRRHSRALRPVSATRVGAESLSSRVGWTPRTHGNLTLSSQALLGAVPGRAQEDKHRPEGASCIEL